MFFEKIPNDIQPIAAATPQYANIAYLSGVAAQVNYFVAKSSERDN